MFDRLKRHSKSPKTPLNEVTVIIQHRDKRENYHESFMLDTTQKHGFEYRAFKYNIPKADILHYKPSFWAIDKKLALFFERHKTLAHFLDWFRLGKKASFEIGYIYNEGVPDPLKQPKAPKIDWALINYYLCRNTTIEGACADADRKLAGGRNMGGLIWLFAIIVIIVAVVVVISIVAGNPTPMQVAPVNATATPLGGI